VLRRPDRGDQEPILAGVGEMQFEVMAHRMQEEYGATVELKPVPFKSARRTDTAGERALRLHPAATLVHRSDGTPLVLFESEFHLRRIETELPDAALDAIVS
jgi:peptide chain release factor 3